MEIVLPDLSISFQPEIWPMMHNSPYVGPPSEAVDKAWEDLLAPMTIRVTDEELQIHNQSSVSLPDGGHFAWLGVFHQLHCVVS